MAKYGMPLSYYERTRNTAYLNLEDLPDHRSEYYVDMSDMSGGLNYRKLPYELEENESPKMENMWWQDGALCCRDGQEWFFKVDFGKDAELVAAMQIAEAAAESAEDDYEAAQAVADAYPEDEEKAEAAAEAKAKAEAAAEAAEEAEEIEKAAETTSKGYSCYDGLYNNYAFAHINDSIYYFDPSDSADDYRVFYQLIGSVPLDRGCWFTYGDYLVYKNKGGYYRIQLGAEPKTSTVSGRTYYKQSLGSIETILGRHSDYYDYSTMYDRIELYPIIIMGADGGITLKGTPKTVQWKDANAYLGWYTKKDSAIYKLNSIDTDPDTGEFRWRVQKVTAASGGVFSYNLPSEFCYTPIMYINCTPGTGAGDSYQPENRISPKKTFWYSASGGTVTIQGSKTFSEALTQYSDVSLSVPYKVATGLYGFEATVNWYSDSGYTTLINSRAVSYYNLNTGAFITSVPQDVSSGTTLYWDVIIYLTTNKYRIPLSGGVDSVLSITVSDADSVEHTCVQGGSGTYDYTVSTVDGYTYITFNNRPPLPYPVQANTVKITVSKYSEDTENSIMNCNRAITYGGTTDAVIVFGGCPAQPNAYFWNGNNTAMDMGYFPFDHYNLGGGSDEYITAFGKQQGYLIIFKEHSIGRSELSSTTLTTDDNARVYLTMDYTAINHKVGCDLPWSIQLCENNLVFANSKQGVYILLDSSSAYENNVMEISDKVDGTPLRAGLLDDLRYVLQNGDKNTICSYLGERRYWLVVNDHAWVWDYEISTYKDPSWFYFTNIDAISFIDVGVELYNMVRTETGYFYLATAGNIVMFNQTCQDFDTGINKLYRTMTMNFGSYDRLKDIVSIVFVLADRKDKRNIVNVDYGVFLDNGREDEVWHENYPLTQDYGLVDRRRVDIKRCHHCYIELKNDTTHSDMSVVRMQVYYKFCGRQRGNGR